MVLLMKCQLQLGNGKVLSRYQAITRTTDDQHSWQHMASPGYNE